MGQIILLIQIRAVFSLEERQCAMLRDYTCWPDGPTHGLTIVIQILCVLRHS